MTTLIAAAEALRGSSSSRVSVSKLTLLSSNFSKSLPNKFLQSLAPPSSNTRLLRSFSSIDAVGGWNTSSSSTSTSADAAIKEKDEYDDDDKRLCNKKMGGPPPEPIPNRPLRGERRKFLHNENGGSNTTARQNNLLNNTNNYDIGGNRSPRPPSARNLFPFDDFGEVKTNSNNYNSYKSFAAQKQQQGAHNDFLEKFKLGSLDDKVENSPPNSSTTPQLRRESEDATGDQASPEPPPALPPQDADEIFKNMKETGLIPNAVAMLDGLCKDGLVQEAMKLFGLMREKGTIPEVVIYTAVVEGFCKAHKLDDAKRIFRKMQSNGTIPNAFSYTVLIQGLYKGKRLEEALDFCLEMMEANHSPNLATFIGLVDGFCREKGLEEALNTIATLRQKGFLFDEKTVVDFLEKKGLFSPLVWEAILGKKTSRRPF